MDRIYAVNEIISIIAPILENYGVSRAYLFGSGLAACTMI